jgi:uncharacterized membrane protein YgcG
MNSKPHKSWGDAQLAIAATALTVTLIFWNLFSTPHKQQVATHATDTATPTPQDATQIQTTPTARFLPVKIIFGGTAPQQQVVIQAAAPQPKRKSGGGGGTGGSGGGGGGSTGSSKP